MQILEREVTETRVTCLVDLAGANCSDREVVDLCLGSKSYGGASCIENVVGAKGIYLVWVKTAHEAGDDAFARMVQLSKTAE